MDSIKIKLLTRMDTDELFVFEKENKEYFKSIGLARADSYYQYDSFAQIIKELVCEQDKGLIYMYLVINKDNNIVGRVNLTDIIQEPLRKSELGYRIGEIYQGKGYATASVKLVLREAEQNHKLHRIEAGTSPYNIGSQIVLIKNGFQFVGRYNQYIFQGDKWIDSLLFEKVID
ncbi:GNAT family protein [Sedimentibacter sp.]|uniref:GNAT family N-acetyltransferase n=1 Tax=Sedimentibacter sp. TaxID=1960295 RepID=UPI0028A848CA|nr:GNAT family protein [Sedimentibacter sp.]